MKNILLALAAFVVIALGAYYLISSQGVTDTTYDKPAGSSTDPLPVVNDESPETPGDDVLPTEETPEGPTSVIGTSVDGNEITAYHFGTGDRELLLIGGIHGGYSWNTALLAFELISWLESTPSAIPEDVRVTVIPVLNPDGLEQITGTTQSFTRSDVDGSESEKVAARFNANNVDLNRNFDCQWQASGTWQSRTVSGGTGAFSEPESQAIRNYVAKNEPSAVIAWYSAAGGVYASRCDKAILPATLTLMNNFATAAKYPAHQEYDYYEITGDMVNWLASEEIPAVSVLLTTHEDTELAKNRAGVEAVISALAR